MLDVNSGLLVWVPRVLPTLARERSTIMPIKVREHNKRITLTSTIIIFDILISGWFNSRF